jgi:hypothetical protein
MYICIKIKHNYVTNNSIHKRYKVFKRNLQYLVKFQKPNHNNGK